MKTNRMAIGAVAVLTLAVAHGASAAQCAKQEPPRNGPGVRITDSSLEEIFFSVAASDSSEV